MPIYAYRCLACGHDHDALQKLGDAPLVDCPQCGKPALKKQITAAAFRLKGSGWYETDFKKDNKKNLHDSDGKEKPGVKAGDKADVKASDKKADKKPAGAPAARSGDAAKSKPA